MRNVSAMILATLPSTYLTEGLGMAAQRFACLIRKKWNVAAELLVVKRFANAWTIGLITSRAALVGRRAAKIEAHQTNKISAVVVPTPGALGAAWPHVLAAACRTAHVISRVTTRILHAGPSRLFV